ncbi:MAG TPA: hypothetical protein VK476_07390, partial [Flavobacterium sp.]|nr:hypothetical protein [Flavobacterium sp.]
MKAAIFSTKYYEREYLDKFNDSVHQLTYFEISLNPETVSLVSGFDCISIQLADELDKSTIEKLAKAGIRLIALRSAGYDNVDI